MAAIAVIRAETTGSVASSFEQLLPKAKEKQKYKVKDASDPLKVLDPVRKKLTSVEAQRVIAVVDDSIKRLELVSLLPYIIENLKRFSVILGSDLVQVLEEHDRVQSSYQKAVSKFLLEQRRSQSASPTTSNVSSRRSSDVSQVLENEDGILREAIALQESRASSAGSRQSLSQKPGRLSPLQASDDQDQVVDLKVVYALSTQMKHSVKTILRLFASNPTAGNVLKDLRNERSFEVNGMIDEMITLRAILFEKLLTTPSEQKERKQYLKQIVAREMKSSETGRKLQEELKRAVDDKENEISKRNDIIRRLKNDIYNVEKNAEEHSRRIITEAAKQDASEMKNSDSKKSKLQQETIELKKKLEGDTLTHRESELALRKRKYKIETEVENWIQKFDTDMGERQDEFDALDAIYTEEKRQLNELEERFKTLEKEYVEIVEARRIAKEKAEAAERELNLKIRAARLIQSLWRAHKARKQLKNKKKKGKKGKKGKKSGGKKKR
ncbi:hypothetical protein OS493_002872 [Desmophyllum pertusum]|uniref:Dynein regulatory complex protein 10 n=1 Tax=Desmophyllum pertusum TaxID=174260 RepID=A0A9X0CGX6_9CNID|nr:hypothetical protein OS493_002872 [Desmophyllum pertusum]